MKIIKVDYKKLSEVTDYLQTTIGQENVRWWVHSVNPISDYTVHGVAHVGIDVTEEEESVLTMFILQYRME